MNSQTDLQINGPFDTRYVAFLETIAHIRPNLHRYCARMTGSVLDGEDLVQEALFEAYRKLEKFDDSRPLAPWLFRIAHNRCIDFLRRREVRQGAEAVAVVPDFVMPVDPPGLALGRAVEHVVLALPPKERACVLLKDVFDYTLEEIAELVDSTIGGVKAALNRGRSKLAIVPKASKLQQAANTELLEILQLYIDRFNQRDWDGLRELISADAQLRVADRFSGRISESPYFSNYDRSKVAWKLALGEVDGKWVLITMRQDAEGSASHSIVRLEIADNKIVRIVDYVHCPWVLRAAASVVVANLAQNSRTSEALSTNDPDEVSASNTVRMSRFVQ